MGSPVFFSNFLLSIPCKRTPNKLYNYNNIRNVYLYIYSVWSTHPHRGKLVPTRTSVRLTGRDSQQSQRGDSLKHLCQPPALLGKKSSGASSATPKDTTSSVVIWEITAALSPILCDPSSRKEISAAPLTSSTLPSSCWTMTSSGSSARKHKTSGGLSWSPLTAPPIPNATGLFCSSYVARVRVTTKHHLNHLRGKTHSSSKATAQAFNRQFTACSAQHDRALRRLMRDLHRYHSVDRSYRPFNEKGVAEAIR